MVRKYILSLRQVLFLSRVKFCCPKWAVEKLSSVGRVGADQWDDSIRISNGWVLHPVCANGERNPTPILPTSIMGQRIKNPSWKIRLPSSNTKEHASTIFLDHFRLILQLRFLFFCINYAACIEPVDDFNDEFQKKWDQYWNSTASSSNWKVWD